VDERELLLKCEPGKEILNTLFERARRVQIRGSGL
jgi:hypothetical protein